LKKKYRDVLALVWGTFNKDGIVDFLDHLDAASDFTGLDNYRFMEAKPQEKYPSKSFIPISHGCDNFCSYCIVPYVRGREVHRKASGIIDNIKRLIDSGVKEAVLLGQNVNSYQDEKIRFPELLNRIANETSIERLGFMTSHPKDFSSELASVIAGNDNIMKNIHLPLQSGNDRILKLMNRKYTAEEYLDKIEKTKEIKGVVLTTDIIVGFPSETEDEFFDTLNLVKKAGFYESFTYHFNARAGTPADKLSGQLSEDVKKRRLTELMETQNSVAKEKMSALIGRRSTVLIDSISKKRKNEVSGRSHQGLMVFLEGSREDLGKIIPIEYTGLSGNGLAAKTCAN
jgi:tRNA-2-methylthio-N6-dimethylallyladenosine synthase